MYEFMPVSSIGSRASWRRASAPRMSDSPSAPGHVDSLPSRAGRVLVLAGRAIHADTPRRRASAESLHRPETVLKGPGLGTTVVGGPGVRRRVRCRAISASIGGESRDSSLETTDFELPRGLRTLDGPSGGQPGSSAPESDSPEAQRRGAPRGSQKDSRNEVARRQPSAVHVTRAARDHEGVHRRVRRRGVGPRATAAKCPRANPASENSWETRGCGGRYWI